MTLSDLECMAQQNFQRHGASHGLPATAELLVMPGVKKISRSITPSVFSDWRPVDSEITSISLVQGNEDNHKVNVENTKITTENISINVSQLQIKQRN